MPGTYRSAYYRAASLKRILSVNKERLTKRQLEEFIERVEELVNLVEGGFDGPDTHAEHMKVISNDALYRMKEAAEIELARRKRSALMSIRVRR